MVDISAGSFEQVVDGFFVHIGRAFTGEFFAIFAGVVGGDDTSSVEAVEADDFDILDFEGIAGFNFAATFGGDAPFNPRFDGFFRTDEGHGNFFAVFDSGHTAVDDVSSPFCGHVVLMIVSCQNCINLFERERVDNERDVTEIGLHASATAHVGHLMTGFHFAVAVSTFAVAAPQVYGDVGVTGRFEPDTGTTEPPHGDLTFGNYCGLDVFDQPSTPFRERTGDPFVTSHFGNLAHAFATFLILDALRCN